MNGDILIIAHSHWCAGRLKPLLAAKGYRVTWCCPAKEDCLPSVHGDFAGTIVLGGPESANDVDSKPYLRRELDWIERHVTDDHRFLGICLGGQLLARALGARVDRHPEGLSEIGYYPIHPTASGAPLIPAGLQVYHWHKEGFELPSGAELLARGEAFPHQAYRYGSKIYGLQFHPEVTPAVAATWVKSTPDLASRPGAQSEAEQMAGSGRFDAPLHEWFDGFLDHWLAPAEARAAAE
jgi:GMP synthase (glutamine-hydrolysing)